MNDEMTSAMSPELRNAVETAGLVLVISALAYIVGTVILTASFDAFDVDLIDRLSFYAQSANLETAAVCGLALVATLAAGLSGPRRRTILALVLIAAVAHMVAGSLGIVGVLAGDADTLPTRGGGAELGLCLVFAATILAGMALGAVAHTARNAAASPLIDPT